MFNYQNERLRENVEELVATMPGAKAFPCDAGDDAQIATMMQNVGKEVGTLDFLVHSIAFAPREELTGQFVNTTRQGFRRPWTSAPIHSLPSPAPRCRL